jgi:hypothetical protein
MDRTCNLNGGLQTDAQAQCGSGRPRLLPYFSLGHSEAD